MIVIVDQQQGAAQGYAAWFSREGVTATGFAPSEFNNWVETVSPPDIEAIEAFLLGDFEDRSGVPVKIKRRTGAAVIAVSETKSLDDTLQLFAAGVDDVVRKPVHVREIMARIKAIGRRTRGDAEAAPTGRIQVFADGRDPVVDGKTLRLPRRERRILEHLMANKGKRVTKTQIFNYVYGLFDEGIAENVIESHISKLRKRLRDRMGFDPVDSQRFLGYRISEDV